MTRIGVDTGGTFTDVVDDTGQVVKLLSTPTDPSKAVADGVQRAGGAHVLAHGTTVATNALLERRGGVTALFVTEGLADEIEIARQVRPSLYDIWADRPEPLVPRERRREVQERLDRDGNELIPLAVPDPSDIPSGIDAAAICLLHADRNPTPEQVLADALRQRGIDVTCSSD